MADLQALADQTANAYGIPTALFWSLISKESNWDPNAVGTRGEIGLGQLMPSVWPALGVGNPYDPAQNLTGSATLLQQLFKRFGNWYDALRGYNAGPVTAQNNPSVSADYAMSILSAAGMTQSGAAVAQPTQGNSMTNQSSAPTSLSGWLADPVSAFKRVFSTVGYSVVFILIAAVLVWFGIQQVIKE